MSRTQHQPVVNGESYRLRVDARLTVGHDGCPVFEQSRYRLRLSGLGAGQRGLLLRMSEGWLSDSQIAEFITGLESDTRILPTRLLVRRLLSHSWLERRITAGGRALLDVVPRSIGARSLPGRRRHGARTVYRLSRFAVMRTEQRRLMAQSPLSTVGIGCPHAPLAAVLARAATDGIGLVGLVEELEVDELTAGLLLDELLSAQVLVASEQAAAEARTTPMALWSSEELWLHNRVRPERHAAPIGATHRFPGPPAARTPQPEAADRRPSIPLPVPVARPDGTPADSLRAVMARRRSVRQHDNARPITAAQLAEFLHRVQRPRTADTDADGAGGRKGGKRPYPGAGGLGELEIYPLVSLCAGLKPGLYHYDSTRHRLATVAAPDAATARMLSFAQASAAMPTPPQVLFVITARVEQLMATYEGTSYSLVLKDAGILTAWMYLIAADMGLAPCALGAGDTSSLASLTGLDTLGEPAVAEFALGSDPGGRTREIS
ncbi:SagB family peptide dehydrogenase [Streptomyces avermitilis]